MTSYNITVQANDDATLPARILHVSSPFWPVCNVLSSNRARDDQSFEVGVDATTPTDTILYLTQSIIEYYLEYWAFTVPGSYTSDYFTYKGDWPVKFTPYPGQVLDPSKTPTSWQQPYVSSFCSQTELSAEVLGPISLTFDQSGCGPAYTVNLDAGYLFRQLNDTGMGFLDTANLNFTPNFNPSAVFAFSSQSYTSLCLIRATWIDLIISGSSSISEYSPDKVSWSWNDSDNGYLASMNGPSFPPVSWFTSSNDTESIHLDLEWLTVLDRGTGSYHTNNYSFSSKVKEVCLGTSALDSDGPHQPDQDPDPLCMASGLSSGIAEGLSKIPYTFDIYGLVSTDNTPNGQSANSLTMSPWTYILGGKVMADEGWEIFGNWTLSSTAPTQDFSNSTRFDFNITQRLYGYGFRDVTITLAFVVLFLYVVTVFIHILFVVFGTQWSSRAWKNPGEMLTLALRSPVPDMILDNTGGGVEKSETWRARASVRELQDGRVGFVIDNQGELDTEDGPSSAVRPDWKYS